MAKKSVWLGAFLLGLFLAVPDAMAANIYVTADAGSSGGNGSSANPYNSIAAALAAAAPGDVVRLRPGVYAGPVSFPHGGTAGNPITLRSDGAARSAVIDCNWLANTNCLTVDRSNVVVDGLEVRNSRIYGIKIDGDADTNQPINGNEYGNYNGNRNGDPNLRRYRVNGADNVVLRNNYIHHIVFDGLKIGHVNNILIENNEVYKTGMTDPISGAASQQQGIDLVGAYGAVIRGNYIHDDLDNPSMDIGMFAKGGSQDVVIENNKVENMADMQAAIEVGGDTETYNTRYTPSSVDSQFHADMLTGRDQATGVASYPMDDAGRYVASLMSEARNVVVRGNVIINANPPLSFRNSYNASAYNNTIINSGWSQGMLKIWNDCNCSFNLHNNVNIRNYNNIFYNADAAIMSGGAPGAAIYQKNAGNIGGYQANNNIYYNQGTGAISFVSGTDSASLRNADPQLSATQVLVAGSPAIGAGADLRALGLLGASETWIDRNGIVRPTAAELASGYDIGALSVAAGAAAPADTAAPTTLANPIGGTFVSPQSVSLSANEPATIYYTIDGSDPSVNSATYASPIAISSSAVLKFFARDPAGNREAIRTQSYVIAVPPAPPTAGTTSVPTAPTQPSVPSAPSAPSSQCTSWVYSTWGSCVNGLQSRTVVSALPNGCIGGVPSLAQACTVLPPATANTSAAPAAVSAAAAIKDSDGDGLHDELEAALLTDKLKPDSDGDGYQDRSELLSGNDPERASIALPINTAFSSKQAGRILLQVENKGQAWYINPVDSSRYYLGRPADAFAVMRKLGLGAKHAVITKGSFSSRLAGRILIDVEDKGKAYYIDPKTLKALFLGRPADAFAVMRAKGLGISNADLKKIKVGGI